MSVQIETERRFLLKGFPSIPEELNTSFNISIYLIHQHYLEDGSRIRGMLNDDEGESFYHTRKKKISDMSYEEDERKISPEEYSELSKKITKTLIKRRIKVKVDKLTWEIDEFLKPEKVAIVEVELPSEDTEIVIPEFLKPVIICEITGKREFTNFNLANPVKLNLGDTV